MPFKHSGSSDTKFIMGSWMVLKASGWCVQAEFGLLDSSGQQDLQRLQCRRVVEEFAACTACGRGPKKAETARLRDLSLACRNGHGYGSLKGRGVGSGTKQRIS